MTEAQTLAALLSTIIGAGGSLFSLFVRNSLKSQQQLVDHLQRENESLRKSVAANYEEAVRLNKVLSECDSEKRRYQWLIRRMSAEMEVLSPGKSSEIGITKEIKDWT